ncbi:MAG TPA: hypothetical protein VHE58_08190 [Burkholderiales bacterium]|nr:hypothetical protein [Burkholderiales bacterium]
MNGTKHKSLLAAVSLATAFIAGGARAEDGHFGISFGADYTSGTYGGATRTDILYVPFTGKFETNLYSLKLTVPYIRISGAGNVVGGISPIVVENEGGGRRGRGNGGFEDNRVGSATNSGLGDIIAAASYNLLDLGSQGVLVDVTGKIKFGTADERKGLGTGENDYSIQGDVTKSFDAFSLFGSAGYRFLGDPPGINLRNVFFGSVGGSYKFLQLTSGGLVYDFAQASSAGTGEVREITAFVSYKVTPVSKFQVYVLGGFSSGSPDYGGGLSYSYKF